MNIDQASRAVQIQRKYYSDTAAQYDQMHLMDAEHNLALDYICSSMFQLNLSTMLDVECGTWRGVKYPLDRDLDVKGIEPVLGLLDAGCRQHGLPAERMLRGSGEALEFADQSFEAAMELGVLHHVPNPAKVVAEMIRVSKRAIYISDCNRFGQGTFVGRLSKIAAWKLGLWNAIDFIRTRDKGYTISEEDGLAYSYRVYDSFDSEPYQPSQPLRSDQTLPGSRQARLLGKAVGDGCRGSTRFGPVGRTSRFDAGGSTV